MYQCQLVLPYRLSLRIVFILLLFFLGFPKVVWVHQSIEEEAPQRLCQVRNLFCLLQFFFPRIVKGTIET